MLYPSTLPYMNSDTQGCVIGRGSQRAVLLSEDFSPDQVDATRWQSLFKPGTVPSSAYLPKKMLGKRGKPKVRAYKKERMRQV